MIRANRGTRVQLHECTSPIYHVRSCYMMEIHKHFSADCVQCSHTHLSTTFMAWDDGCQLGDHSRLHLLLLQRKSTVVMSVSVFVCVRVFGYINTKFPCNFSFLNYFFSHALFRQFSLRKVSTNSLKLWTSKVHRGILIVIKTDFIIAVAMLSS